MDEGEWLTHYVLTHYKSLLTEWENKVTWADWARSLVRESPEAKSAQKTCDRMGQVGVPEVDAALADGIEPFRRRVRDRILAEHGNEVVLNRCPECGRLARTPLARQCFECGRDWHHEDSPA